MNQYLSRTYIGLVFCFFNQIICLDNEEYCREIDAIVENIPLIEIEQFEQLLAPKPLAETPTQEIALPSERKKRGRPKKLQEKGLGIKFVDKSKKKKENLCAVPCGYCLFECAAKNIKDNDKLAAAHLLMYANEKSAQHTKAFHQTKGESLINCFCGQSIQIVSSKGIRTDSLIKHMLTKTHLNLTTSEMACLIKSRNKIGNLIQRLYEDIYVERKFSSTDFLDSILPNSSNEQIDAPKITHEAIDNVQEVLKKCLRKMTRGHERKKK